MENKILFQVKDLCFSYEPQIPILRHVNLTLPKGKIITIMGANGCGKSTLFQLLTKNLQPVGGGVYLEGQDIESIAIKDFAKRVAIVHQYNTMPEDLTVQELVEYGRTPYKKLRDTARIREKNEIKVEQAMKITRVDAFRNRTVQSLSGGQKQRVWLAMAIAQGTKILFLDEPTTYLDVRYQLQILKLVKMLNDKLGMTIIMVLHDINQALFYSDEVIALSAKGTVLAQGKPEEVIIPEKLKEMYGIELDMIEVKGKPFVLAV